MNIDFKSRIKNKVFWVTLIPAVIILIQSVCAVFGFTVDLGDIGNNVLAVIESAFVVLAILGIVVDPTTSGISDGSKQNEK